MTELVTAVAYIFRMKGTEQMTGEAAEKIISFQLRWFSPADAKRLLTLATESGLVTVKGGVISPTFDVSKIDIPHNYRPGPGVLSQAYTKEGGKPAERSEKETLFDKIMKKIMKGSTLTKEQILAKINSVQSSMDLDIEVAAIIVAKELDIEVLGMVKAVEDELVARYSAA